MAVPVGLFASLVWEGRGFFPGRSPRRLRHTHLSGNPGFRNAFLMRLRRGRLRLAAFPAQTPGSVAVDPLRCSSLRFRPPVSLRCTYALPLRSVHRRASGRTSDRTGLSRDAPARKPARRLRTCTHRKRVGSCSASEEFREASREPKHWGSSSLERSPALNRRAAWVGGEKGVRCARRCAGLRGAVRAESDRINSAVTVIA